LARLPQVAIEHHWRRPPRELSWKYRMQSSLAQPRMRSGWVSKELGGRLPGEAPVVGGRDEVALGSGWTEPSLPVARGQDRVQRLAGRGVVGVLQ
jgi:hypothetical protein